MPPLRRSARLKRTKAAATVVVEEERLSTREKKRREIFPPHHILSPSADNKALTSMASGVWSDDSKLQLDATTQLLKLVSVEEHLLIDEVIQSGVVPRLVEFLIRDDCPQLQCEAARVLKNIASGTSENTEIVIDYGAIPAFVKLLESSNLEIREQAAWALGNIAGDSPRCRDIVLNCGALHPLLMLLNEHKKLSFLRIGIWTLSNFLEGEPEPPFEQLESAIPILASLIITDDEAVLREACWALLYLSHCKGGLKLTMFEAGICSKLGKLLWHAPPSVLFPAIRAISSIVSGADRQDERPLEVKGDLYGLFYRKKLSPCIVKEARNLNNLLYDRMGDVISAMRDKLRQETK
ncbi:hypothetical protein Pfo_021294 [Paulownia fortunei]|nr:hypothetical protein Pfo_021294 [Paulownia fortunei]